MHMGEELRNKEQLQGEAQGEQWKEAAGQEGGERVDFSSRAFKRSAGPSMAVAGALFCYLCRQGCPSSTISNSTGPLLRLPRPVAPGASKKMRRSILPISNNTVECDTVVHAT